MAKGPSYTHLAQKIKCDKCESVQNDVLKFSLFSMVGIIFFLLPGLFLFMHSSEEKMAI